MPEKQRKRLVDAATPECLNGRYLVLKRCENNDAKDYWKKKLPQANALAALGRSIIQAVWDRIDELDQSIMEHDKLYQYPPSGYASIRELEKMSGTPRAEIRRRLKVLSPAQKKELRTNMRCSYWEREPDKQDKPGKPDKNLKFDVEKAAELLDLKYYKYLAQVREERKSKPQRLAAPEESSLPSHTHIAKEAGRKRQPIRDSKKTAARTGEGAGRTVDVTKHTRKIQFEQMQDAADKPAKTRKTLKGGSRKRGGKDT